MNTETSFHHYHIFRFLAFWKCNAGFNLINKTALLEKKREVKENSSVLQNSGRRGDWIKFFVGPLVASSSRIYLWFLKSLEMKKMFLICMKETKGEITFHSFFNQTEKLLFRKIFWGKGILLTDRWPNFRNSYKIADKMTSK